jgi:hypothetical protein
MSELIKIIQDAGVVKKEKVKEIFETVQKFVGQEKTWEELASVKFEDPTDKHAIKVAAGNRKIIRDDRLDAEKFIKGVRTQVQEKMAEFTAEDKAYLKMFQYFETKAKEYEGKLKEIEETAERLEKERLEKLVGERRTKLAEVCDNPEIYPVDVMSDEAFEQMYNSMRISKEAEIKRLQEEEEARRKAEEEELAKQAALQMKKDTFQKRSLALAEYNMLNLGLILTEDTTTEEFTDMLKQAEKAKEDWDVEQMKIRKENERLRLEQLEKEKELAAAQKANEEKEKALAAERKALNEQVRKQKEEEERKIKEEQQKAAALAKASGAENLAAFLSGFQVPDYVTTKDETVEAVRQEIVTKFKGFKSWASTLISQV